MKNCVKQLSLFEVQKYFGIALSIISVLTLGNNLFYFMLMGNTIQSFFVDVSNLILFAGIPFFIVSIVVNATWLRNVQLFILFFHCLLAFQYDANEMSGWFLFIIVIILGTEYGFFLKHKVLKFSILCAVSVGAILVGGISASNFWEIFGAVISGIIYLWFLFFLFYVVRRKPMDERELDGPADDILSEQSDSSSNESVWDKLEAISDYHFTKKEISVLCLFLENDGRLSNKEIADRLGCGVSSVKNHLSRIAGKLGTHSRAELLKRMMDLMKS